MEVTIIDADCLAMDSVPADQTGCSMLSLTSTRSTSESQYTRTKLHVLSI